MWIPSLGGGVDVVHGLAGVPSYRFARQIFFAQTVGCIVVSVVGGVFQPLDAKFRIVDAGIIREQQLSKGILGGSVSLLRRFVKPVPGHHPVRRQQRAVPTQLSHKVLSMDIAALCKFPHIFHGVIPLCQRQVFILNVYSQRPEVPGRIFIFAHLIALVQGFVLKGDLPQPNGLRLLNDRVLDLAELFLPGQRRGAQLWIVLDGRRQRVAVQVAGALQADKDR